MMTVLYWITFSFTLIMGLRALATNFNFKFMKKLDWQLRLWNFLESLLILYFIIICLLLKWVKSKLR